MKPIVTLLSLLMLLVGSTLHAAEAPSAGILNKLGIDKASVQPAPIAGWQTVLSEKGVLYISDDGKYIMQGTLYDVSGKIPVNVTSNLLKEQLDKLQDQMIIYPAKNEKYVVTVFTDITCGYCQKLHKEIDEYNNEGITIRYLAFPRQGMNSKTAEDMRSIWCQADKKKAFDNAIKNGEISSASCNIDLQQQYNMGGLFGITGTPALILEDGMLLPGYLGPKELLGTLENISKLKAKG